MEVSEGERRSREASGFGAIDINVDRHFNPAQIRLFFKELTLESLELVRTAGRDYVRLRAVLRPVPDRGPTGCPWGPTSTSFASTSSGVSF